MYKSMVNFLRVYLTTISSKVVDSDSVQVGIYEVASPRVVEAIFAECVPVLISEGYVRHFSDVLNWGSFSIEVGVKDIGNIKKILLGVSESKYLEMQRRVKMVKRHFVPNDPPKRFDVFHMTIHSVWLRRRRNQNSDSSSFCQPPTPIRRRTESATTSDADSQLLHKVSSEETIETARLLALKEGAAELCGFLDSKNLRALEIGQVSFSLHCVTTIALPSAKPKVLPPENAAVFVTVAF
ncbi:putative glycosyltransferase [Senna tora]|uniref:Putative glycosyltransferase n=1 Tax=Senna tora TaxID=362788 RepID=A0A835CEU6_9FABA|nr:putative glycosyltransferase [Senna tora]